MKKTKSPFDAISDGPQKRKPVASDFAATAVEQPQVKTFYMVAALVEYHTVQDGITYQASKHVNMMLEADTPMIVREDLNRVNQGIVSRMNAQAGVSPSDVQDIIILNIVPLAMTDRKTFMGQDFEIDPAGKASPLDGAPAGSA